MRPDPQLLGRSYNDQRGSPDGSSRVQRVTRLPALLKMNSRTRAVDTIIQCLIEEVTIISCLRGNIVQERILSFNYLVFGAVGRIVDCSKL